MSVIRFCFFLCQSARKTSMTMTMLVTAYWSSWMLVLGCWGYGVKQLAWGADDRILMTAGTRC